VLLAVPPSGEGRRACREALGKRTTRVQCAEVTKRIMVHTRGLRDGREALLSPSLLRVRVIVRANMRRFQTEQNTHGGTLRSFPPAKNKRLLSHRGEPSTSQALVLGLALGGDLAPAALDDGASHTLRTRRKWHARGGGGALHVSPLKGTTS
jgi:hypothetical protein